MRVLFIHCRYKEAGGEDSVVEEEMKLLRDHNIAVSLLEFSNDGGTFGKLLQLPFNWKAYNRVKKAIAMYNPDVVHVHNLHFAGSASILVALNRSHIPYVMTLHNYRLLCPSAILYHRNKMFIDSLHEGFPWKAVFAGVYKNSRLLTFWLAISNQVHKWAGTYRQVPRFITLTPFARKLFLESKLGMTSTQVVVKPNFIYSDKPARVKRGNEFLFVGRLTEDKGIRSVLETFSHSGETIIIVGEGPLQAEVAKYSKQYPNIKYYGAISRKMVMELMRGCTALIFPSTWYEGMPMTIIEAFSQGCAVIASRLGAMQEMIVDQENGLHFEPNNATDLAAKLEQWQQLSDVTKQAYRLRARQKFEQLYSPDSNFQQLLTIYRDVMQQLGAENNITCIAAKVSPKNATV